MAIDFTSGVGHLFNRLGALFKSIQVNQTFQASTLATAQTDVAAQFTTRQDMLPSFQTTVTTAQNAGQAFSQAMSTLAQNVLLTMIQEDSPQPAKTLAYAIPELILQMNNATASVVHNVVTAGFTAGTNIGTGTLIVSTTDPYGFTLENILAETLTITCTADSLPGQGATAGQERFTARGDLAVSALSYQWPLGSAGNTSITASSADVQGTAANAITNGNFETWTGTGSTASADSWTLAVGTWGTTAKQEAVPYTGTYSVSIIGNASELTKLTQSLRSSTVAGVILPQTKYALAFWTKVSSVPSGGVLRIALKDTSSGTIYGSVSVTLSGETTAYALHSTTFNMPLNMPSTLIAVIELTTALDNTKKVYIDNVVISAMAQHQNGPFFAIIPGSVNFIRGDVFNVKFTNDRGGQFQEWFSRCFNMPQLGLVLPSASSGAATIPNSIIA